MNLDNLWVQVVNLDKTLKQEMSITHIGISIRAKENSDKETSAILIYYE